MPNQFCLCDGRVVILCLEKTGKDHHAAEEEEVNLCNLHINPSGFGGQLLIYGPGQTTWPTQPGYPRY